MPKAPHKMRKRIVAEQIVESPV